MSTRCQIGIYEKDTQPVERPSTILYKHWDGYPAIEGKANQGMIPLLLPFLKDFRDRRGLDDMEYLPAWLMHYLIQTHVEQHKKTVSEVKKVDGPKDKPRPDDDGRDMLGYGVCPRNHKFHGDIEWYYRITPTALYVHSPRYLGKEGGFKHLPANQWPVTVAIDLIKNSGKVGARILNQSRKYPENSFKAKGVTDGGT